MLNDHEIPLGVESYLPTTIFQFRKARRVARNICFWIAGSCLFWCGVIGFIWWRLR